MKRNQSYRKVALAVALAMVTQLAIGSFIGSSTSNDRRDKYSLKNFNKSLTKNYSLSAFRAGNFQFGGSQVINSQRSIFNNSVEVSSIMRFENGNTAYVFPYKYRVKASKFKTPTPSLR